jgi:predicted signal transduction protein with EAL and GGDEF domain
VLESLREPVLVGAELLHASGSVGISLYPADGEDADALMRSADAAMYHAKERGRDNYQFFTPRVNEAAQRRGCARACSAMNSRCISSRRSIWKRDGSSRRRR